jgi:hypothetical protein
MLAVANPATPRSHRFSTLDHVHPAGRITAEAVVVNDSTTDYRTVMARLDYVVDKKPVVVIKRRVCVISLYFHSHMPTVNILYSGLTELLPISYTI